MAVYLSKMELLASRQGKCNPLPVFCATHADVEVEAHGKLELQDYSAMGRNVGFRVLPYLMQDRYSRADSTAIVETLVLENENLCATFLPDHGARLWSLYHKREQRELLFRNPVLQLGNLGIRNAWFSGGIEWNIGQFGHTFGTCSPMFAAICTDQQACEFVRFYQFERCREVFWQPDFHLPPGVETLHLYAKIINDKNDAVPMYWWTNIAVPETEGVRVFSEDARVLYLLPEQNITFGQANLPELSSLPGKDASYPGNFSYSSEYFFQNDSLTSPGSAPWEAACYENGQVFFERSSRLLRYRKMFCWGRHAGGQRWKDFLSLPGQGNYLEIQGGMAQTQLHGLQMPGNSEWDFVQCFGGCSTSQEASVKVTEADANCSDNYCKNPYSGPWSEACQKVKQLVERHLPEQELNHLLQRYRQTGAQPVTKLLHNADGWGALELRRRTAHAAKGNQAEPETGPSSMVFPAKSLGPEQSDWLCLLEHGYLPEPAGLQPEVFSWQVGSPWQQLLEKSLAPTEIEHSGTEEQTTQSELADHWYSRLQLGVMYYEQGQREAGLEQWQKSVQLRENPIAYRNIGYHHWKSGDLELAASYYQKIFDSKMFAAQFGCAGEEVYFAEEYLEILLQRQRYEDVWSFYRQQTAELHSDRLEVLAARAAVELGEREFTEQLLQKGYPQLKEGENWFSDIWFIAKAKEVARQQGLQDSEKLRQQVRREFTPPPDLDFRMK